MPIECMDMIALHANMDAISVKVMHALDEKYKQ
jgi:hypothetical protein